MEAGNFGGQYSGGDGQMWKISIFLGISVLLVFLSGCTTMNWHKVNATPKGGRADIEACAGSAGLEVVSGFAWSTFPKWRIWAFLPGFSQIDFGVYKNCMKKKGYRLAKASPGESARAKPPAGRPLSAAAPRALAPGASRTTRNHSRPHPFGVISSIDHGRYGDLDQQLRIGRQALYLDSGRGGPVVAELLLP